MRTAALHEPARASAAFAAHARPLMHTLILGSRRRVTRPRRRSSPTTARSSPTSSPPRPTSTRATAASSPRSRRGGTSSSSTPVIREALGEAGAELTDVERIAVTRGPGARSARCSSASRRRRRSRGRCGCRWSRSTICTATSPRSSSKPDDPLEPPFLCLLASGGHTLLLDVQDHGGVRRRSGRRSTTPPARPSTRARACSGSATRAAPRSTGSRREGDPRRSTSRSRGCPGSTSRSRA